MNRDQLLRALRERFAGSTLMIDEDTIYRIDLVGRWYVADLGPDPESPEGLDRLTRDLRVEYYGTQDSDEHDPPLVAGGQGRTGQDVYEDGLSFARVILLTAVLACICYGLLVTAWWLGTGVWQ